MDYPHFVKRSAQSIVLRTPEEYDQGGKNKKLRAYLLGNGDRCAVCQVGETGDIGLLTTTSGTEGYLCYLLPSVGAAVGVVAYSGYTSSAKKAAVKSNQATISKMVGAKAALCATGESVNYTTFNGADSTFNCPVSIDTFIKYMNDTIYGLNFLSPYNTQSKYPSWCKINVTNCNPPGYMTACPSHPEQPGYYCL